MKNFKFLGIICILVSGLMFTNCTTDTLEGPPGRDGRDGIDGINGTDGKDGQDGQDGQGTASCIECHSSTHRDPIDAAYALSGHANGTSWGRGTRGGCAQCHNNQGFIDYTSGQFVDENGLKIANPDGYGVSTAITCTGCHSDHRSFDFDTDGNDYAVRTLEPVQLMTDLTYIIDIKNESDVMGKSNTCVVCHQPRRTGPVEDGSGEFTITSSHWGPHHGPQATFLEGIQGIELAGSMSYPSPGTATHRSNSSCVQCHMGTPTETDNGSHTWVTSETGCLECHGSVPSEVTGFEDDFHTLETLLENVVGWEYQYEVDANGDLVRDANGDYILVLDGNGDPVINEAHGVIHDGHPNNGSQGRGATFTTIEAQAGWNYLLLLEDSSLGVHNPAYARALLKNSIEALQ